jgi:hypothetical protein
MRDCMVEPPFCEGSTCGSLAQSVIYWVLFEVLTTFILVGMITAIVVNNFEEEFEDGEAAQNARALPVSSGDIVQFGRIWWKYARDTGDVIFVDDIPALFNELEPGLGCEETRLIGPPLYKFIDSLKIPADARCVQFVDVLYRLSQHVFLKRYPGDWKDIDSLPMSHEKMVCVKAQALRQFPRLRREGDQFRWSSYAISRVLLVQRLWRGYKARKQLQAMMVQRLKEQGHDSTIVEALARGEDVDLVELQRLNTVMGTRASHIDIITTTSTTSLPVPAVVTRDNASLLSSASISSSSPATDTTPPDSRRNSPVLSSNGLAADGNTVVIAPIDLTNDHAPTNNNPSIITNNTEATVTPAAAPFPLPLRPSSSLDHRSNDTDGKTIRNRDSGSSGTPPTLPRATSGNQSTPISAAAIAAVAASISSLSLAASTSNHGDVAISPSSPQSSTPPDLHQQQQLQEQTNATLIASIPPPTHDDWLAPPVTVIAPTAAVAVAGSSDGNCNDGDATPNDVSSANLVVPPSQATALTQSNINDLNDSIIEDDLSPPPSND